jgi:hypothetical protein
MRRPKGSVRSEYFADGIQAAKFRFGRAADFPGMEDVYHEHFDRSLSIDDAEFFKIVERNQHVRLADGLIVSTVREIRQIVGYYSAWGLAQATVDALISGQLLERDLTAKEILQFSDARASHLYIGEICATKKLESTALRRCLLADAIDYAGMLFARHSNLRQLSTWVFSIDGNRLAHDLGLQDEAQEPPYFASVARDTAAARIKMLRRKKRFRESYPVEFF